MQFLENLRRQTISQKKAHRVKVDKKKKKKNILTPANTRPLINSNFPFFFFFKLYFPSILFFFFLLLLTAKTIRLGFHYRYRKPGKGCKTNLKKKKNIHTSSLPILRKSSRCNRKKKKNIYSQNDTKDNKYLCSSPLIF